VLTARSPEAQQAIYDFLKAEGLEFKKENIVGLGNSTGEAKANWIIDKAADGFNDFYFADDAYQNVKAVQNALGVIDVKSKVQQAIIKESKKLDEEFNKLLEETTDTEFYKEYSSAKAKTIGSNKGKFKFFIPYSAEDFLGLIYPTLSKGAVGDSQMAWYKKNILDPYTKAQENISAARVNLMNDFKALKKSLNVPKNLRKKEFFWLY
jgi:predicted DNA-binding protein